MAKKHKKGHRGKKRPKREAPAIQPAPPTFDSGQPEESKPWLPTWIKRMLEFFVTLLHAAVIAHFLFTGFH